jgi:pimeloyl-ACP methyl ester carboxylesterase
MAIAARKCFIRRQKHKTSQWPSSTSHCGAPRPAQGALPIPEQGSLTPPTLVLWGDQDIFAEPRLAEQTAALCADARVVHFPNASHWLPHDEAKAIVGELLGFLKR